MKGSGGALRNTVHTLSASGAPALKSRHARSTRRASAPA
jgi:hypothetical protein